MAITNQAVIAGPVNFVFQQTLLRNAKPRAPHFAGSTPGDISSNSGTFSVKWRRVENMTPTTTALTELTGNLSLPTRNASQPSVTDVTATVAKYGDFIFLTEEVDLVNFNGQTDKLVEVLGIQAGRSLNRLQRNVLEDNATLVYPDSVAADADVVSGMTRTVIRNVVNTLNRESGMTFTPETTGSTNVGTAAQRPAFMGICHSDVEEDIRDITGFIASENYASQTATAEGEFGAVAGVRWVSTPEASIDADLGGDPGNLRSTTGVSADLYTSMIIAMDYHGALSLDTSLIKEIYTAGDSIPGIVMINKEKGSAGTGDPLNEVSSLGWKAWHAGTILNSAWGRGVRTGATDLQ